MRLPRHVRIRLSTLVLATALGSGASLHGCASSQSHGQTAAALSAEDARLFECGVDFIARPDGLAGRWREDWSNDLDERVKKADAIANVTVRTLRTDTAPDRRVTHRLLVHVDRVIHGTLSEPELELTVRDGSQGFASVDQASARLTSQPFVAYVKRGRTEAGEPTLFFHLSPASEEVIGETEAAVVRNDPSAPKVATDRTVVHTH